MELLTGRPHKQFWTRACTAAAALYILVAPFIYPFRSSAQANTAPTREQQIQAAFLYKFLGFISWEAVEPGQMVPSLCVYKDTGLVRTLERLVQANNGQATVRKIESPEEGRSCSLLYIGKAYEYAVADIIRAVQSAPVVTVSDINRFTEAGGIIQFTREGNHIRFIIAPKKAEETGVRISSRLLALARTPQG